MSVEFLSRERVARYGRFVAVPSPGELKQFFRLDAGGLELARSKRREHNRLRWALQWGTVRMLGTFLTDPTDVPTTVTDFAAYGRIFKTLHILYFVHDEGFRRMIGTQLNVTGWPGASSSATADSCASTTAKAWKTSSERSAVNAVTLWNSWYTDAAVKHIEAAGFPVTEEQRARLPPLNYEHINFHGRYAISRPDLGKTLWPLRDPDNQPRRTHVAPALGLIYRSLSDRRDRLKPP